MGPLTHLKPGIFLNKKSAMSYENSRYFFSDTNTVSESNMRGTSLEVIIMSKKQ